MPCIEQRTDEWVNVTTKRIIVDVEMLACYFICLSVCDCFLSFSLYLPLHHSLPLPLSLFLSLITRVFCIEISLVICSLHCAQLTTVSARALLKSGSRAQAQLFYNKASAVQLWINKHTMYSNTRCCTMYAFTHRNTFIIRDRKVQLRHVCMGNFTNVRNNTRSNCGWATTTTRTFAFLAPSTHQFMTVYYYLVVVVVASVAHTVQVAQHFVGSTVKHKTWFGVALSPINHTIYAYSFTLACLNLLWLSRVVVSFCFCFFHTLSEQSVHTHT